MKRYLEDDLLHTRSYELAYKPMREEWLRHPDAEGAWSQLFGYPPFLEEVVQAETDLRTPAPPPLGDSDPSDDEDRGQLMPPVQPVAPQTQEGAGDNSGSSEDELGHLLALAEEDEAAEPLSSDESDLEASALRTRRLRTADNTADFSD